MKNQFKFPRLVVFAVLFTTVVVVFSGCVHRHGQFSVISTRNIDWSRSAEFTRGSRVEGRDIVHIVIFVPTGTATIFGAVDHALNQVPGAVALVDAVLSSRGWYIPWIYGRSGWTIEGSVLIDPALASIDMYSTTYLVFHIGERGEMNKMEVSEAEFLNFTS